MQEPPFWSALAEDLLLSMAAEQPPLSDILRDGRDAFERSRMQKYDYLVYQDSTRRHWVARMASLHGCDEAAVLAAIAELERLGLVWVNE